MALKFPSIKLKNHLAQILIISFLISMVLSMSCQTVKPYQRSYLNDSIMKMGLTRGAGVESYAQMIREGASGAGGKNGGGCGCN